MIKLVRIAAFTIALAAAPWVAGAGPIDFAAEAQINGERGIDGSGGLSANPQTIDGVSITFASSDFAYLDAFSSGKPGGLGVCKVLTAEKQCDPGSDDNLGSGEWVSLTFDNSVTISGLTFNDANHNDLSSSALTLLINSVQYTFADAAAATFTGASIRFDYDAACEGCSYYVSGMNVPEPGTLALLGLGILGFGLSRRKKA